MKKRYKAAMIPLIAGTLYLSWLASLYTGTRTELIKSELEKGAKKTTEICENYLDCYEQNPTYNKAFNFTKKWAVKNYLEDKHKNL